MSTEMVATELSAAMSDDDRQSGSDSDEASESTVNNKFANDGSFMEMFKNMQQKQQQAQASNDQSTSTSSSSRDSSAQPTDANIHLPLSKSSSSPSVYCNKRRTKTLKVGVIKRQKKEEAEEATPTDAWSRYMTEVRKYKEKYGDDGDKNRPLVK